MCPWRIRCAVMVAVLVSGCVPSLFPLYTDKDQVFDPALVGTWGTKGGEPVWIFQKGPSTSYAMVYTGEGGKTPFTSRNTSTKFECHLVRIGKSLFMDSFPNGSELPDNDFYKMHLIAGHLFSKVIVKGDELRIVLLNPEWVKEGIEKKKFQIKHEIISDRILLTASTPELQRFITRYAEDSNAFETQKAEVIYRLKPTTTTSAPAVPASH
jgi:hypothetical protein